MMLLTDAIAALDAAETELNGKNSDNLILLEASNALRLERNQIQLGIHGMRKVLYNLNEELDRFKSLQETTQKENCIRCSRMIEPNFEFLHGRTTKNMIELPKSWEEDIDMSTVTIHLTQVGSNQDLRVKRHQGNEIHLSTNGLPVDCYYMIVGELLDKDD